MMCIKPLVINLFGGPGSGKSTTAALLFGYLKQRGYNVELVTEYAKELVWEERNRTLGNQVYLLGKQTNRLEMLRGKVDAIITDSPLLLCSIYKHENYPASFDDLVKWQYDQYNNLNYFLQRQKDFNPKGRVHNLEESIKIDQDVRDLLEKYDYEYNDLPGNEDGVESLCRQIESKMRVLTVFR